MSNNTLMVNESNSKKGLEVLRMFREETEHPMELTTELLMKLLDDNKDTEYGRKYDFANIRSIEDYQKKVPVVVYDDLAPYLERMMEGEKNLLTAGEIKGTKTIAHNQVYTDADMERMIKAGDIFFQTTPQWMRGDEYTGKCLGKERFLKQFPVGTMKKNGVRVSFGSDSCLEPETADAFFEMYCACTRGDRSLWNEEVLPPSSERLTRMESLYAYTINGAMQLSLEHETGSISEGKSADFLILDRDIIECTPEELKETKVLNTFFRGKLQKPGEAK